MGCMSSKQAEAADKEAVQRTVLIDKTLKNDKKLMDRTIKILLLGMPLEQYGTSISSNTYTDDSL
jgi:hypothetical protein